MQKFPKFLPVTSNSQCFSSTPPAALIMSPKLQNMFTTFKDSLLMTTDSAGSPSRGLTSPVHFLHLNEKQTTTYPSCHCTSYAPKVHKTHRR